jgi:hypothetical protein
VPRWLISGLIVADELPTEPLTLLDCTIVPLEDPVGSVGKKMVSRSRLRPRLSIL